jgi:hypothetical protein
MFPQVMEEGGFGFAYPSGFHGGRCSRYGWGIGAGCLTVCRVRGQEVGTTMSKRWLPLALTCAVVCYECFGGQGWWVEEMVRGCRGTVVLAGWSSRPMDVPSEGWQ